MNNPYRKDQLLDLVKTTFVDVLGCNSEEITKDAALVNDLGADSLDFVEFRYMIEKQLGITLPHKSVLEHLATAMGGMDQIYKNGKITPFAATVLRESPFQYSEDQVVDGMLPYEIMAVTTVSNWVSFCYTLFDYLPAVCPNCNANESQLSHESKAICAFCGSALKPQSGDAVIVDDLPRILSLCPSIQELV